MRIPAPRALAAALLACGMGAAPLALGQDAPVPTAPVAPAVDASPAPAPEGEAAAPEKRPGLFHVGPVYVTPRFRVNSLGFDTNVLYTPTERRADFLASGGPGIEVVLPIGHATRVSTEGRVDYLYFLRTASQRHLAGGGAARVERVTPRSEFHVEESFLRTFDRPSFEVDRRVLQDREQTAGDLRQRVLGRISVIAGGSRARVLLPRTEDFLGVALGRTLRRNEWTGRGGLEYALTPKTSVVADASRTATRFPLASARDGTADEVRAGLRTDATALIAGHALFGLGWFRLESGPRASTRYDVADVLATLRVSPRTSLGVEYQDRLLYSALATEGAPTLRSRRFGVHAIKELLWRLDLHLDAGYTRFRNTGSVALATPEGVATGRRSDRVREAAADLGYLFRSKVRVGARVGYTERDSTVHYFGIQGLVVGATVTYAP